VEAGEALARCGH